MRTNNFRLTLRALTAALVLGVLLTGPVRGAAAEPETTTQRIDRLTNESMAALERKDWAQAEKTLKVLASLDKENFVPWYNLACALAHQDKIDEANATLLVAVARGFSDLHQLRTDPDLANLRDTRTYKSLIAGWGEILKKRDEKRAEAELAHYGPEYKLERDDDLHLTYISAFDPVIFDRAREQITQLAKWWRTQLLPADEPWRGEAGWTPPRVLVVLPTRKDFVAWAMRYAGAQWDQIGGMYSNDDHRLIAQGLGANMRHEFWHVLHWRNMNRLGQRHPVWVMEGLCSLVEDIKVAPDGSMIPITSWRTNIVHRLARGGRLTPWDRLFRFKTEDFRGSRKLAYYAQARSVFLFLYQRGHLRDWYTAFVKGFDEDPTGLTAMATVFGKPASEVEDDYRAWARDLEEVPEEIRPGMTDLPFEVQATGEGLQVTTIVLDADSRRAGLKGRDVITAIAGEPVHDLHDLVRIMTEHKPGDEVSLECLRRGEHFNAKIDLVEAK